MSFEFVAWIEQAGSAEPVGKMTSEQFVAWLQQIGSTHPNMLTGHDGASEGAS
ncbi:hypothetical protein ACFSTI_18335 [Rhizorhabdus histidinilytica]